MDLPDLAEVLSPYRFDYILFDACFMGSVEVLYELRHSARYFIASPAEILADGFPYHLILPYLIGKLELEKVAQEKQTIINQKKAERQAVLERAMNDRDTAERAYNELMASSASITAMLQQRAAERAAAAAAASQGSGGGATTTWVQGTGQLAAPVNAPITSDFGWRIHPIYGTSRLHAGTDFGVDEGTPVHAADGGVVVEAGWISGYGYTVIIDHGNGMSTLYAHNSDVAVSPGQTVSKGQVVSYSGNTGGSTGPHLHFEVRINGEPTDPMGYL